MQNENFIEQLMQLKLAMRSVQGAHSLLRRTVGQSVSLCGKEMQREDTSILQEALRGIIVNNLHALFDKRQGNSLFRFPTKHPSISKSFFKDFKDFVESFFKGHKADFERIKKNRHLATAHLGDGREMLGFPLEVTRSINSILGTNLSAAQEPSLHFIAPIELLQMPVVVHLNKVSEAIDMLHWKFCQYQAQKDHNEIGVKESL